MNWDNLRRAAPGKFEGGLLVDAIVYEASLDGTGEETGDADATGWFGFLRGGIFREDAENAASRMGFAPLTTDERAYLADAAGFILSQDGQGFVTVDRHATDAELVDAWRACEADDA